MIETEALNLARMISPSKSTYRRQHPDHLIVFNANIFTRDQGKIWYGDLDVTLDGEALKAMAAMLDEELYIFREYDSRIDNENDPLWDAAVARVTAESVVITEAGG